MCHYLGFLIEICIMIFIVDHVASLANVQISKGPQDETVVQGQSVVLTCVVDHVPSSEIDPVVWKKGKFFYTKESLKHFDRYSMTGDVSIGEYNFFIKNVQLEDEDFYECHVSVENVNHSRTANLTVLVPPTGPIVKGEVEGDVTVVEVAAGIESVIVCKALKARPQASLNWYKDGELVNADVNITSDPRKNLFNTSATLRILPNANDLKAKYSCVMKSNIPESEEAFTSLNVKLKVIDPPNVSLILPEFLIEKTKVIAECKSHSDSRILSYRWYVNNTILKGEQNPSYEIDVKRKWHGSRLSCQAKNMAGFSSSSFATIKVFYAPIFIKGNVTESVEVGGNITLRCLWDANPKPVIEWTREGDVKVLEVGSELHLINLQQNESGNYSCHARSKQIGSSYQVFTVVVYGKPEVKITKKSAQLGDKAVLTCEVTSQPGISDVTWKWESVAKTYSLHNKESIFAQNQVKYQGEFEKGKKFANLIIYNVDEDDFHSFTCKATNSYGSGIAELKLEKEADPHSGKQAFSNKMIYVLIGIGCVIFFLCFGCLYWRFRRRGRPTIALSKADLQNQEKMEGGSVENLCPPENCYHVQETSLSRPGTSASSITPTSAQDEGYSTEGHQKDGSWNQKPISVVTRKKDFPTLIEADPLLGMQKTGMNNCTVDNNCVPGSRSSSSQMSHGLFEPPPNHRINIDYSSPLTFQEQPAQTYLGNFENQKPFKSLHDHFHRDSYFTSNVGYPYVDHVESSGRASDLSQVSHTSSRSSAFSQPYSKQATRV